MKNNLTTKSKNAVWIGTACCLAYAGCYTGRNILSAVMPQLTELGVFSEREHRGRFYVLTNW